MARPLRIEFEGALYHVTSRGNKREEIFRGDSETLAFIKIFYAVCQWFNEPPLLQTPAKKHRLKTPAEKIFLSNFLSRAFAQIFKPIPPS